MLKKITIFLIDFYRNHLSALKIRSCRFYPTCSAYTKEAITRKGVFIGIAMGAWRIFRCNPFTAGGFDPVDSVGKENNG